MYERKIARRWISMSDDLKKRWSQAGYSQEEAYFFQKDRELIQKRKEKPKLLLISGKSGRSVDNRATDVSPPAAVSLKKAA